jgi:hypothetical protein
MRTLQFVLVVALCGAVTVFALGCGGGASEDKPIEDVKAEVKEMDVEGLKALAQEYRDAIAAKTKELEPLQKQALELITKPEELKAVQEEITALQASVAKLTERLNIVLAELTAKGG